MKGGWGWGRRSLWWCDETGIRKESSPPTGLGLLMSKCCALLPTITSLQLSKSWWLNRVSLSTSGWQKWSWFTQIPCEQKQLGFSHLQWRLDWDGGRLLVSVSDFSGPFDILDSILGIDHLCCKWHPHLTRWHGAATAGWWSQSPTFIGTNPSCVVKESKLSLAVGWFKMGHLQCANKNKNSTKAEFWTLFRIVLGCVLRLKTGTQP